METSVESVRTGCTNLLNAIQHYREHDCVIELWFLRMPPIKIDQIKIIRASTKMGLKEAKDMCDSLDPQVKGGTLGPVPFKGLARNARRNIQEVLTKGSYPFPNYNKNFIFQNQPK